MTKYPFTFACYRSGNCCSRPGGQVRVGDREIAAIAAHLGMNRDAFVSRYLRRGEAVLTEAPGGACVFLAEGPKTSCGIYAVRPEKCRSWPFWPELLESPDRLEEARRLCPGIVPTSQGAR